MNDHARRTVSSQPGLIIKKLRIDERLFTHGFAAGCGPSKCTVECCEGGVYVDRTEHENILRHTDLIRRYMDETQPHDSKLWFEPNVVQDEDYPSGECIGTETYNDKCVFLNKDRLCVLQVAGEAEGFGKWGLKPYYCIAYPIVIEHGIVTFDDMLSGEAECCTIYSMHNKAEHQLIEACAEELRFILGEDGYTELIVTARQRNK